MEYKDYETEDLEGLTELIKENYGDIAISNKDYLKWQYEQNPAGKAIVKIAVDEGDGSVIGQCARMPVKLKVNDEILKGAIAVNTLTQKEYRKKGVYTKLSIEVEKELRDKGLSFTYNFPNPNSYPIYVNKLGSCKIGTIPLLIRPVNLKSFVCKKVGNLFSILFLPIQGFINYQIKSKEKSEIHTIYYENLSDIDLLWESVKNEKKIMGVRNAEFFKWRYLDIPIRNYKIFCYKEKGKVRGCIVGRCKEINEIKFGMIVDFIVDSRCPKVGTLLVKRLMQYFYEQNVNFSGVLMLKHTKEYKILKKNGFFVCPKLLEPQPFRVVLKEHGSLEKREIMYDINNWFLTMGDYDVI